MLSSFALQSILAISLSCAIGQASPLDTTPNLIPRQKPTGNPGDIISDYKCSNAPGKYGGELIAPEDIVQDPILQPSGSAEVHAQYLWCTTGKTTYTFFGFDEDAALVRTRPTPRYKNYYRAFDQLAKTLKAQNTPKPGLGYVDNAYIGNWTVDEPNSNVRIFVKSNKGQLNLGVAEAAFTGLANAMQNYNTRNIPTVFTIYHASLGEVGIGYAGEVDETGVPCSDNTNGISDANKVAFVICSEISKVPQSDIINVAYNVLPTS